MEKTCTRCGAEFTIPKAWAKRGDGKFCGRACYFAHQRETPHAAATKSAAKPAITKTCGQCGASFRTYASQNHEHCSRACLVAANSVQVTCVVCGESETVKKSRARSYRTCSERCREARQLFRPCARCGVVFKANHARHAHCSEECRRPPVLITCLVCEKRIRIVPSDRSRFCSKRCYRRHTGETTPERNVRLALEELGISYRQEAAIRGWTGPVDFLLPDGHLVVEVDEPYWHDKVAERDARKDAFMASRKLKVLRIVATPYYGDYTSALASKVEAELDGAGYVIRAQMGLPIAG